MKNLLLLLLLLSFLPVQARKEKKTIELPTEAQLCLERGDSCMDECNLLHAMKWFSRAMELCPTEKAVRRLAECHFGRGDFNQALSIMNRIPADSMTHAGLRLKYQCFGKQKAMDSVFVWGNRIVEDYPLDADVVADLAAKYIEAEKPEKALKVTYQYYLRDSMNVYVNRQMGYAEYLNGQYADAIRTYERLVARGDRSVIVLFPLGMCHYMSNDRPNAYRYLRMAAEATNQGNATCMAKLGIVATQLGHDEEGVECLEQAVRLFEPSDDVMAAIYESLGDAHLRLGQMKEGVEAYQRCLNRHPENPHIVYYEMAQAYGALKDSANERKCYRLFLAETQKLKSVDGLEEAIAFARARSAR